MKYSTVIPMMLFLFLGQLSVAQKSEKDSLYWYKVDFDIVRDSIDFEPSYKILKTYPEIITGFKDDFLTFQKENMKSKSLAIGPFKNKASVQFSIKYYSNCNEKFVMKKEDVKDELYWYFTKIEKTRKAGELEYARTAARVAYGNINEFKQVLYEGLFFLQLCIGPFFNQPEAEYSKFLNRILEPKRAGKKRYIDYDTFYWLKADIDVVENIGKTIYEIKEIGKEIEWGTFYEFSDYQKKIMKTGFVAIGPFSSMEAAKAAKLIYSSKDKKNVSIKPERDEYYWYMTRFKKVKSNNKLHFVRVPAAVSMGEIKNFVDILTESLQSQFLVIGPFESQTFAEESKRLNRKLE